MSSMNDLHISVRQLEVSIPWYKRGLNLVLLAGIFLMSSMNQILAFQYDS